jgi:hypothetical protein
MAGKSAKSSEHWQDQPEAQDYPAAENYLSLLVGRPVAHKLAKALRKEITLEHFAAKDILRASGLTLLPADDPEVLADFAKVKEGEKLSPVLLIQGEPLWVADGYHRICTSYHLGRPERPPRRRSGRAASRRRACPRPPANRSARRPARVGHRRCRPR